MVSQASILERIIAPNRGGFSAEHARYVLSLDFSPDERARYAQLSERASAGTLDPVEQAEIDEFLAVNALLMILKSMARVSLNQHPSAA